MMLRKERMKVLGKLRNYSGLRALASSGDAEAAAWVSAIDMALLRVSSDDREMGDAMYDLFIANGKEASRHDIADARCVSYTAFDAWVREFFFAVLVSAVEAGLMVVYGSARGARNG